MTNDRNSQSKFDVILSDSDFTKEVFARAKKENTKRKKIRLSIISLCSAFVVFALVLIPGLIIGNATSGAASENEFSGMPPKDDRTNDVDASLPAKDDNFVEGFADYVMIDGSYLTLTPQKSKRLGEIINSGIQKGDCKSFSEEILSDYLFVSMVGGVRYLFFSDGISFGNKTVRYNGLGNEALAVIND